MKDGFESEIIRIEVANGRVKKVGGAADDIPSSRPSNWGTMYAVCHIAEQDTHTERLCNRLEGIAQETYRRSPGGVTNRLRQALRNANRYLYLRNRARGDRKMLLAAMSCVAIRGADAYASGAGLHAAFIVSDGRMHSCLGSVPGSGVEVPEDWQHEGNWLGLRPVLSEPRFSYRQALPGDLVLLVAAADDEVIEDIGDTLALIGHEGEIQRAAQHVARLGGGSGNLSALLVRVGSVSTETRQEAAAHGSRRRGGVRPLAPASHPEVKSSGLREHDRQMRGKSRVLSKGAATPHRDVPSSPLWPRASSTAGSGGSPTHAGRSSGRPGVALLAQCAEMCRVAAALVLSLIHSLWRGGLELFRSLGQAIGNIWRWTRRHRLFERAGRGCELALLACWAGSKGLIVRVLPERQSPAVANSYSAAAGPMARVKVVGFNPSRTSRLIMGALIVLAIFLLITASAVRIKSLLQEADLESLVAQVEETMLLAEGETDREERIALLSQAGEMIEDATGTGERVEDNVGLSELGARLETEWDAASGVVRIPFEMDETLTIGEGAPQHILIHEDQVYILDPGGEKLYHYMLDQDGRPLADQGSWTWDLQAQADTVSPGSIVDMVWADAANGRLTPAVLMLTAEGSLLELNSAGVARNVSVSDVLRWESASVIRTYYGSLYVLDTGRENVVKYIPTGDNYEHPPVNYFQESENIEWAKVVDVAVDGSVYLLLSDGSVLKYTNGEADTFTMEGLYPPLEDPTSIFASTDSGSVFVAESQHERIVEFSTAGQFIRQFRAANGGENPMGDLGSFAVDPRHGWVFVGAAGGVYRAPLLSPE